MIKLVIFLFFFSSLQANSTLSQNEKYFLDGDFAQICFNNDDSFSSVKLLDKTEGQYLFNRTYNLKKYGSTYKEMIEGLIRQLKINNKTLAFLIDKYWKKIDKTLEFSPSGIVFETSKYPKLTILENGCQLELISRYQLNSKLPHPEFYFNKDLWDAMDEENKSFLILNSIIFSIYKRFWNRRIIFKPKYPNANPDIYRYLTSLFLSEEFSILSDSNKANIFKETEFPFVQIEQLTYLSNSIQFHKTGKVKRGYIYSYSELFRSHNQKITILGKPQRIEQNISFHQNNQLESTCIQSKSIYIRNKRYMIPSCNDIPSSNLSENFTYNIKFSSDGKLERFYHQKDKKILMCDHLSNCRLIVEL